MHEQSTPSPSALTERKVSRIVMIVASVIYGLSLLPWLLLLFIAAAMVSDHAWTLPASAVILAGVLGWPVTIAVGLVIGWRKRRYLPAILGSLAPILFAVVILVIPATVNPRFLAFVQWQDPKALRVEEKGMAGITLEEDADTVIETLGAPWVTLTGERSIPPEDGIAMARQGHPSTWQYPAVGLTVDLTGGKVQEVALAAPWKEHTARDLLIGEDMADVPVIFGEFGSVATADDQVQQVSVISKQRK